MLLRLQTYDLTIRYQPGKDMEVADALSRLSAESQDPIPEMNVRIHKIFPQFSSSMLQKIKEQSSLDAELNALKEMIHAGCTHPASPNTLSHRRRNSHEILLYYHSRHAAERDFDETTRTTLRNREN